MDEPPLIGQEVTRALIAAAIAGGTGFVVSVPLGIGVSFAETAARAWKDSSGLFTLLMILIPAGYAACVSLLMATKGCNSAALIVGSIAIVPWGLFFMAFTGPYGGPGIVLQGGLVLLIVFTILAMRDQRPPGGL